MDYSGLIALSTFCLNLLSAEARGTDTGLELSTPPIRFTRSTLLSSAAKSPSLSSFCYMPHSENRRHKPVHFLRFAGPL